MTSTARAAREPSTLFHKSKRITIMDGDVHTFACSFQKKAGVFGTTEVVEGPFEISVSRNALMVHFAKMNSKEEFEAFNAALKAAQELFLGGGLR